MRTNAFRILGFVGVAAFAAASAAIVATAAADAPLTLHITALSTDASRVTGGDVLLQVTSPDANVKITANGRDVSSVFHPGKEKGTIIGLVAALPNGRSTINATSGKSTASLEVTNYPITGPVFSGPWLKPYICQTQDFVLPDGSKLGAPLDENCSARTVVQYVYRSKNAPAAGAGRAQAAPPAADTIDDQTNAGQPAAAGRGTAGAAGRGAPAPPAFLPLASTTSLPADVAMTTTTEGVTVPFVVRVETGTMDRGIYQSAILFDPTSDAAPSATAAPKGWNHRLIGVHGSGCPGGWYIQGGREGVSPLDLQRLGQGYAVFVNSLNHPTNSCNAVLAGEAAMMGKEHFIEEFGVPLYTISTGGSGGAYTSLQLSDAYPGLFDGASVSATFPDALA
ncbi:MAG TPA: DUF6351 family protein, partial [Vicinamibacterales bacterium]|nr:DUF6351 family protein [Vicinamibacterales bacterium]